MASVEISNTRRLIERAIELIDTPDKWRKGPGTQQRCMLTALVDAKVLTLGEGAYGRPVPMGNELAFLMKFSKELRYADVVFQTAVAAVEHVCGRNLPNYNDAPDTTHSMVIAKFREAAEIEVVEWCGAVRPCEALAAR